MGTSYAAFEILTDFLINFGAFEFSAEWLVHSTFTGP